MLTPRKLQQQFKARFGAEAQIYCAPGRVNLIGEHTDYNDGFVLPAAIDLSCLAAVSLRNDSKLALFSEQMQEVVTVETQSSRLMPLRNWTDYVDGVVVQLRESGYFLGGANLYFSSEVPIGAGLSSSAALEVSAAYALLGICGHKTDPLVIAKLCQKAENEFVGAKCGIMDQFVCCHGRAHHALLLDCRSLEYRPVRLPDALRIVICNTMVKHELGHKENQYNLRRAQCEESVGKLSQALPSIRALREVSIRELQTHRNLLNETLYKRCRHVVTENARVPRMAAALENGDLKAIAELMAESHRSLREDYEVSCPELDLMVDLAERQKGIHGARMTGAGFGGCTVNLVEGKCVEQFRTRVSAAYSAQTGKVPEIYVCQAAGGAAHVSS